MTVVGHVEQLAQSACYRGSETLTCVTCHDPHGPVAPDRKIGYYRSVCMTCHEDSGCKLPLAAREVESDNCVVCHMPHAETEVPHVAFTHHHIGIHPLQQEFADAGGDESLIPISDLSKLPAKDRKRATALAYAQLCQRLPQGQAESPAGRGFRRATSALLRNLPDEVVDAAVEVARAEFSLRHGEFEGSVQAARRALDFANLGTDEAVRALVVLAFVSFQQNQFEEARDSYARLTRLRRDAGDWHHLGLCENNCGNVAAAIRALEKAREIDPSSVGSCEALAMIHQARKEFDAERRLRDEIARLKRWASARAARQPISAPPRR
jgi:predicted CXXCH cytochrome family protein